MIRINIIPILNAINNEFGTNELIKRIKNILNINLTELENQNTKVEFKHNTLSIINLSTKVKYNIEFQQDYFKFTKDYESYKIIYYFDFSKNNIRKTAAFKTSDSDYLVIDEIDEENILSRRILKTIEEDTEFLNGDFEREELYYRKVNASEKYKHLEDLHFNKNISKTIKMPNNLYIYSYRTTLSTISKDYQTGYIESSSCINNPTEKIVGRTRNKGELLVLSINSPVPNIYIRGRNVTKSNESEIEIYNIYIHKREDKIHILFTTMLVPSLEPTKEEFIITSNTDKEITIDDINKILQIIENNLKVSYLNEIKKELLNIKEQILQNKKSRTFDFFDNKFFLFPYFESLVFDVHENLSTYEEIINKLINNQKDNPPPTLKKI